MLAAIVAAATSLTLLAAPAGAAYLRLTTSRDTIYPLKDGFRDSTFIHYQTGDVDDVGCLELGVLTIRRVKTGEVVFRAVKRGSADPCHLGTGYRWWGRYNDIQGTGKRVPAGEYRIRVKVDLVSGETFTKTKTLYVKNG